MPPVKRCECGRVWGNGYCQNCETHSEGAVSPEPIMTPNEFAAFWNELYERPAHAAASARMSAEIKAKYLHMFTRRGE